MLVQRLRAIQDERGYLPDTALAALAAETGLPLYRIQEVASFFPHFRQEWAKPPRVLVKVCRDMACHLRGAAGLLGKGGLADLARPGEIEIEPVSCLGRCDRAPAITVDRHGDGGFHDRLYAGRTPAEFRRIVESVAAGKVPRSDKDSRLAIDRSGWQIDPYAGKKFPPYSAARQLATMSPPVRPPGKDVEPHPWLEKLNAAGLLGMGGAGVPAYRKWLDVWRAKPADGSDDKYVVCNGDESEPGTFKDREILLHLPHLVVEGVILAGLLTRAKAGYIYIRHEYGEQIEAVRQEIRRAEALGACGADVFETGRAFPVEVFVSPGGYVCGEQSALIEAMEDRRAQPRNKPPELSTNGYRDRPTVVNNVETLAWAPGVMLNGADWYARAGRAGCKGRRLFSICGDLEKPGVYEVPIGTTLGELIDMAGGTKDARPLKAVATSGPSGGLLPAMMPLSPLAESNLEKVREGSAGQLDAGAKLLADFVAQNLPAGSTALDVRSLWLELNLFRGLFPVLGLPVEMMLGAGLAVYAEPCDILNHAVKYTEFYRNESCGKCVPCRIGSQKLVDIGTDLIRRRGKKGLPAAAVEDARKLVEDVGRAMYVTSICGLGQVAWNPLATALTYFPDDARGAPT